MVNGDGNQNVLIEINIAMKYQCSMGASPFLGAKTTQHLVDTFRQGLG